MICSGEFYEKWKEEKDQIPAGLLISIGVVILYIVLNLIIVKHKNPPQRHSNHQNPGINFGDWKILWFGMSILLSHGYFSFKLSSTEPQLLNQSPNKYLVYIIHGLYPALVSTTLAVVNIYKSKQMRKTAKNLLCFCRTNNSVYSVPA